MENATRSVTGISGLENTTEFQNTGVRFTTLFSPAEDSDMLFSVASNSKTKVYIALERDKGETLIVRKEGSEELLAEVKHQSPKDDFYHERHEAGGYSQVSSSVSLRSRFYYKFMVFHLTPNPTLASHDDELKLALRSANSIDSRPAIV